MYPPPPFPPLAQAPTVSRSLGLKLLLVCALILVMGIPGALISVLNDERATNEAEVKADVGAHVGGRQTFLGPTLAIPYTIPAKSPTVPATDGVYIVFAQKGDATVATTTEERHRSLYRVPVFHASLQMSGDFDLTGVASAAPAGAQLNWSRAEIVIGVTDARGALADGLLTTPGGTATLTPSRTMDSWFVSGDGKSGTKLTMFGVATPSLSPGAKFSVKADLKFSGADRVALLAYAKSTEVTGQGDWHNPGFDGGILPTSYVTSDRGFKAKWNVPFIARSVRAEGAADTLYGLEATAMGTSFVEVADPYHSVTRALKYVLLFLSLVFLTYFVFEATTGKRVHPAQYILIGVAQLIFYLLLLSFAERTGFDYAFLLAGGATIILLSANAGWIFASRAQALRSAVAFSLLYGFIYMLLKLEDNALLIGALASFAAVSAVMYATRNLDWYGSLAGKKQQPPPTPGPRVGYESLLDPL